MIKKIFSKIILLPFLFPFIYQLKIPFKGGSFNFLDIVLCLSIFFGLNLINKNNYWPYFKEILKKNWLIFLLIGLGLISLVLSSNQNWLKGLSLLKSYLILPVLFTITVKVFVDKRLIGLWDFFYSYLIYSSILAFFVIWGKLAHQVTFDNRVVLFFDSPNQLAIALALGIVSCGILLKEKRFSGFAWSLICFLFMALLFTESTGSILAVLVVLFFILNAKANQWLPLAIKVVIFISILTIFVTFLILPRMNYNPFLNKNSLDSRIVIHLSSQKILLENPIKGVGLNNFQEKYLDKQSYFPPYPQWSVPHSHNLFLQIWLSFGILGLIIWTYLIIKKATTGNEFALYFILYFLVHGLVDVPIWNNDQALFFWFIFLL